MDIWCNQLQEIVNLELIVENKAILAIYRKGETKFSVEQINEKLVF